ncbi:uncharacterized protein LOC124542816 [Vanessa cardui]|uniref:uncharacterized protein LOC124542816 n=1 Tax=Vanessa cardui TaxID=171605 RepID=UPI001F13A859|nr:uncharacterized protein LOC124542816 [Vanessa cardui]
MSEIEKLLKELRLDIKRDTEKTLLSLETSITTKINDKIDKNFNLLHGELEQIKETNSDHNTRISAIEKHIRQRNLIFFGIKEEEKTYEELESIILQILKHELKLECDKKELEMVRRMGKHLEGKVRPIVVTFTTYGRKITILKNKKCIQNKTIYIKEDYPPQVLEARKKLQEKLKKERKDGKIAYLRYDKLIVREKHSKDNSEEQEDITKNTETDKTRKKRELEITPPSQIRNYYKNPTQQQAVKENKMQPYTNRTGKSQSSMENFFAKQNTESCKLTADCEKLLSSNNSDQYNHYKTIITK